MKEFALNGSLRTETGKKVAKQLRKDNAVPAVLYGGEKNILLSVAEKDLKNLIYTPDVFIVNLSIDKKPYKAIIKELQFHPVTDRVLHLDFFQVFEDKNLTIALPVKLEGSAEGVKQGGRLNLITRKLRVSGLIKDLPENITINIADLALGDSREVSDLKFDNFEIVDPKTTVIATVKTPRVIIEEEEELEAATEGEGAEGEGAEGEGEKAPDETATEK